MCLAMTITYIGVTMYNLLSLLHFIVIYHKIFMSSGLEESSNEIVEENAKSIGRQKFTHYV